MSRTLRRVSAFAAPALALALLPFTGLAADAHAAQSAKPAQVSKAAAARAAGSAWKVTAAKPAASKNGHTRTVHPTSYKAYTLDSDAFVGSLAKAPLETSKAARRGKVATVKLPAPTGELITFAVVESPVMQRKLQKKHPEIRTYSGTSITKGYQATTRFDVTPQGVHAIVRGVDNRAWEIDPAYLGDTSLYLSFFGASLPDAEQKFREPKVDRKTLRQTQSGSRAVATHRVGEGAGAIVKQRVYRLALLTDPSYANYVAPGLNDGTQDAASNAAVLAAKTTLMNRVNEIYNDDLAVKMVMINGTDALNLNTAAKATGANGPCGAQACYTVASLDPNGSGCVSSLLTRTRYVIGLLAGAGNFDIGHIALGINGGGIASLGVVGGNNKAQGCTGLPFPVGDFMAIDYTGHEMGHQFSGNHTFASLSLCGSSNRSAANSVEPGGGSSVMAYAGICASDDLQDHSDPYFSQRTQQEVSTYINGTPAAVNEVQMTALSGFDGTESFKLSFNGVETATITRGTNYTAAALQTAIQAVTGGTVAVTGFYGGTFDDTGFRITWSGTTANVNVANGVLVNVSGGFTGYNSDIAQGGPATNGGGTVVTTTNHNPTVTAPANKTIPIRTPFALTGSAVDSDGDPMLYLWEQNNRATSGTTLISNAKTNGPLFRQFGTYADVSLANSLLIHSPGENIADGNPTRVFPDMAQVLAGSTNAATGSCPAGDTVNTQPPGPVLDCYSEYLPTVAYIGSATAGNAGPPPTLTFRLTARDTRAGGGGTSFADTVLSLDLTAGPLLVTSQAAATSYNGDSDQAITWNVNSTDKPTLAPNVKISLSTDGGATFPTVLAASTPNDGSETVTLPNVSTTNARIKIEAVDNYFFDVNDAAFTIVKQSLVNTLAPSISGTPQVGQQLTADPGTWNKAATYSYQWYANGTPIGGATGSTFTPTAAEDGKFVSVYVTASRSGYDSVSAASDSVRISTAPLQNTGAPVITGTPTVGSTLSLSDGTWNYGDVTLTYQWYADGNAIRGARSNTYLIPGTMVGKVITGKVTASRPGSDAVTATSSNSVTPS